MSKSFMADWVYTPTVKEHFMNPHHLYDEDKDKDWVPDGEGEVGSLACGDQMKVGIKVKDDKITDLKWLTYGCASAIASTSMMSDMAIGMSLEEAYHLTPQAIMDELGGLPEHKFHCSVLGDKALRAAIDDYLEKQHRPNLFKKAVAKIVCECKGVTDQDIENLVKSGQAQTLEDLARLTAYGTGCGKCKNRVKDLFLDYRHIYGYTD